MYLFISGIVGIASMASIGGIAGIAARIEHFAALLVNEKSKRLSMGGSM